MSQYREKLPEYGDLIPKKSFISSCKSHGFIDYDGHGYPVKGKKMNSQITIYPSRVSEIPEDATHIIWFNR